MEKSKPGGTCVLGDTNAAIDTSDLLSCISSAYDNIHWQCCRYRGLLATVVPFAYTYPLFFFFKSERERDPLLAVQGKNNGGHVRHPAISGPPDSGRLTREGGLE